MRYTVTFREPKRPHQPRAHISYQVDAETKEDALHLATKSVQRELPGASLMSIKPFRETHHG